jgi:hypothetical protein
MPRQKILDDEFPLAGSQRTAASTTRYLTTIGFWAGLNLDDVVERGAMRTFKKRLARRRNVRRFAPHRHGTPPRCCNEQRRYVFGGFRAIRCKATLAGGRRPLRSSYARGGPVAVALLTNPSRAATLAFVHGTLDLAPSLIAAAPFCFWWPPRACIAAGWACHGVRPFGSRVTVPAWTLSEIARLRFRVRFPHPVRARFQQISRATP